MQKKMITFISIFLITACGGSSTSEPGKESAPGLTGKVRIDGSSTVFPISEAVAEEFGAIAPGVRVTVGVSGTGGGFKKFVNKETDISDASTCCDGPAILDCRLCGFLPHDFLKSGTAG